MSYPQDDRLRPDPTPLDQSWAEYRRLVLGELERLGRRIEDAATRAELANTTLNQRIDLLQSGQIAEMRVDMAALKARSGLIGGLMGALTGIGAAIGSLLLGRPH